MKKILFLLILISTSITSLFAGSSEFKTGDYEWLVNTKTKLAYYYQSSSYGDNEFPGKSETNYATYERREIKNYLDITSKYFKISSTIGYYMNNAEYDTKNDLNEVWLGQDKDNLFVEKLYGQVLIYEYRDWDFSFAYGIIPLTGGNIKKFSTQDEIQGNGLFTIIDLNMEGGFFILSNENHIFKIGQLKWDEDNWQGDQKLQGSNGGTDGLFAFYEYHNGKHLLELDFIDADVKYQGQEMADAQMYGLGYSYDDSMETGFAYYGIAAMSVWQEYWDDILNNGETFDPSIVGAINGGIAFFPDQYDFENGKHVGYSLLLGTKYYTEIFGSEASIGVEYMGTSKHWASFNNGSLFNNDVGYWMRRGSNMGSLYTDFSVTRDFVLSAKYQYVQSKYTAKNGSVSSTTETPPTAFYKKEQNFMFKATYTF